MDAVQCVRVALHDGQVCLLDLPSTECGAELRIRFARARGDQQARGPGVEPMDQAGRERVPDRGRLGVTGDDEGRGCTALARVERMRRHAARLVHHDQLIVLVDDRERDVRLGRDPCGQDRGGDAIAWAESRSLASRTAVHADLARGDDATHDPTRTSTERPVEEGVQSDGRALGTDRERQFHCCAAGAAGRAARFSRTSS